MDEDKLAAMDDTTRGIRRFRENVLAVYQHFSKQYNPTMHIPLKSISQYDVSQISIRDKGSIVQNHFVKSAKR